MPINSSINILKLKKILKKNKMFFFIKLYKRWKK